MIMISTFTAPAVKEMVVANQQGNIDAWCLRTLAGLLPCVLLIILAS